MSDRLDPYEELLLPSLDAIREARLPWWAKALDALRYWAQQAFRPVPAVECAGCAKEREETHRWQERADELADQCLRLERKLSVVQAREVRTAEEVGGATDPDIAVAYDTLLPEQAPRFMRQRQSTNYVSLESTTIERPRPLPPIMRRAVREQKVFTGSCTRTDGNPAPTNAQVMEGAKR